MIPQLKQSIQEHASKNAFCISKTFYTYSQLNERASAVAAYLSKHNKSKAPVGIFGYDAFETYAAIIGTLWSGAAYVPIHPSNPKDRNNSIGEQAQLNIILSASPSASTENGTEDINGVKLTFVSELETAEDFTLPSIAPEDIAYILFTSGSTGIPKGVPISHQNLSAFLDSFFSMGYYIDAEDRFLQMFDITFDLSVMSYLVPLLRGACVYTVPFDSIKYMYIYELIEEQKLTFALMVPSILSYLRPYFIDVDLPYLKHSLFCGEALYADITKEWQRCVPNAKVQNVYGPTEATIFCLAYHCDEEIKDNKGMVCIGKPMKNCDAIIVDESNTISSDNKGELCLGGLQVTNGYLNDPLKNKESFFNYNGARYYKTGDIVFMDEDQDIMYAGRKDYQVKVMGGFRVELSEIEHHARIHSGLTGAVAVAVPNSMGISQVYLFMEQFEGDKEEVFIHLKKQMPEYMIPTEIISVSRFPLNANGKIDRKELGKMIAQQGA